MEIINIKQLTKRAEQGDVDAQCDLGDYYYPDDKVKSAEWFDKAAQQGSLHAIMRLGNYYYFGEGVPKSYEKAVELYKKAAEQGVGGALCYLGVCYEEGKGVKKNIETAVEWYKKAIESGHSDAKFRLDYIYRRGLAVPNDGPQIQADSLGSLTHNGTAWSTTITSDISGKGKKLIVEFEGSSKDKVTDVQRKALAEYTAKSGDLFKAAVKRAKEIYAGAAKQKDGGIIPQKLYIDRKGNYGWVCQTKWNDGRVSVILSDGDVQFADEKIVYKYEEVLASRKKKKWHLDDSVYISLWGHLTSLSLFRADEDEFEDEEDEEIVDGKLTSEEVKLLTWLINKVNTMDIADDVVEYCNDSYDCCYYDSETGETVDCDKKIARNELHDELDLTNIYLNSRFSQDYDDMPDISITGECECDPDHGIAIGFKNKEFIGVGSEDFAGF